MSKFEEIIKARIKSRVPLAELDKAGIRSFYVAGNCLNKDRPNDIDLFPAAETFRFGENKFPAAETFRFGDDKIIPKLGEVVSRTNNANTVKMSDGRILQFCNYFKGSLEELVDSFDFSHVQIGAHVEITGMTNIKIYVSEAYKESALCQTTSYQGSEFPLSSLLRTFKYKERGNFSRSSHVDSVYRILTDIIKNSPTNIDGFKNQLDAIDDGNSLNFDSAAQRLARALILNKQALCANAALCVKFARDVIQGRFADGEASISKNAAESVEYATIINGRFEDGEEAIIKENNSGRILHYYYAIRQKLPENLHNLMTAHALVNDKNAMDYFAYLKNPIF